MLKKHSKLLIAALLVGSVGALTLSSCDNANTSSSESSVESFIPGVYIAPFDKNVTVGDIIDLDDYVSVDGKKDYDATVLTAETAILDGHKLTIVSEGTVRVKISKGDEDGVFSCQAISALKAQLQKDTDTAGNNYFIEELELKNDGSLLSTGTGTLHNDNYFSIYSGDIENGQYTRRYYEGIVKTQSGNTYWYTMDDLAGTNLDVQPGKQAQFDLYYLAAPLNRYLNYSMFDTVTEGEQAALVCDDAASIQNFLNYDLSLYSGAQLAERGGFVDGVKFLSESLNLSYDEYQVGNTTEYHWTILDIIYFEYQGQTVYDFLFAGILNTNPEATKVKGLDDYIASGEEPTPITATELSDKIGAIATADNYKLDIESYFTDGSNIIEAPSGSENTFLTFSYDVFVDKDTYFYVNNADNAKGGYTIKDGKTYGFTNLDDGGTVTDTIAATENANATSAFKTIESINDASLLNEVNVTANELNDAETMRVINFDNLDEFGLNLFAMVPEYGSQLAQVYAQSVDNGSVINVFFDAIAIIQDNALVISLQCTWDTDVTYECDFTFTGFGTTDVTELLSSVVFPA